MIDIVSLTNFPYLLFVGNLWKYCIFLMKRMPNFIDWMQLRNYSLTILKCLFLKKETNFISRIQKVILGTKLICTTWFCTKNRNFIISWFKIHYKTINLFNCCLTNLWGEKIWNNSIAILFYWWNCCLDTHSFIIYAL